MLFKCIYLNTKLKLQSIILDLLLILVQLVFLSVLQIGFLYNKSNVLGIIDRCLKGEGLSSTPHPQFSPLFNPQLDLSGKPCCIFSFAITLFEISNMLCPSTSGVCSACETPFHVRDRCYPKHRLSYFSIKPDCHHILICNLCSNKATIADD